MLPLCMVMHFIFQPKLNWLQHFLFMFPRLKGRSRVHSQWLVIGPLLLSSSCFQHYQHCVFTPAGMLCYKAGGCVLTYQKVKSCRVCHDLHVNCCCVRLRFIQVCILYVCLTVGECVRRTYTVFQLVCKEGICYECGTSRDSWHQTYSLAAMATHMQDKTYPNPRSPPLSLCASPNCVSVAMFLQHCGDSFPEMLHFGPDRCLN